MKARDIVLSLMAEMPKHTSKVSSFCVPSVITANEKIISVQLVDHGLRDGNIISITDAKFSNGVSSITDNGDGTFTVSCEVETDFTTDYSTVTLQSASQPSIDGEYPLVTMEGGMELVISGYTFAGAFPDDVIVVEDRGININSLHIVSVVDNDNFTFENTYKIRAGLCIIADTVKVHNKIRISRGGNIERLVNQYNAQPPTELIMYVVLGGTSINKDDAANSDDDMEQGNLNDWHGMLGEPFNVYVFQTLGNDATGGAARDDMSEIRIALYKSILGRSFDSGTVGGVESVVYPVGDDAYDYQKGYYIHEFEFRQSIIISREDTASDNLQPNVAMKSISFDIVDDNQLKLISGETDLQN